MRKIAASVLLKLFYQWQWKMPHRWWPLAHERNSIFKCKQIQWMIPKDQKSITTQWCSTLFIMYIHVYLLSMHYLNKESSIPSTCNHIPFMWNKVWVVSCSTKRNIPILWKSIFIANRYPLWLLTYFDQSRNSFFHKKRHL